MSKRKRLLAGDHPVQLSSDSLSDVAAPSTEAAARDEQPPRHSPLFAGLDILLALAMGMLIGAAYLPIVQAMQRDNIDYEAHASFAQRFVEQGILVSPACLLHLLIAAVVWLGLTASYESATLGVVVCSHASVAAVLYLCARWAFRAVDGHPGRFLSIVIAVIGPFVQPLVPLSATYTIGYIWAEPYHSPTYALLKPFALAAAAFAVYFLAASRKPDWRLISLCAITVAAGTLAKPSFAICALPAVVLCSAYQYARQAAFSKIGVLCGWLLPALVVLLWQYFRTYASSHDPARYANSIIFAPLAVMTSHTSELAAPYFWSILLPASVLVVYGKRAWADGGLRFSLTAFLFGTTYAYTLAEQYYHFTGNFLWSAYITMFIVYFFSTVFVLKQLTKPAPKFATLLRALPCLVVLTWNLAAGVSVHMNYFRLSR